MEQNRIEIQTFSDSLVERDGTYYAASSSNISYPEHGNEECFDLEGDSFWFQHRNDCIAAALRRHARNDVFFDIGGGNGFVAKRLQDEGFTCVLVEPGQTGARNARARKVAHVVCASLEGADIKPGTIPSAGLFDVLEHVEDDVGFLTKLHTHLAPEGLLLLTVPAYQALWSSEDEAAGHFRRYTCQSLANALTRASFEVLQSTYIFSVLPPAIWAFRALPHRLGLSTRRGEQTRAKEHRQGGGLSKILDQVWKWERTRVARNEPIAFGGSCLVVARKAESGGRT